MSDKHEIRESEASGAELSEDELGDVFGGRMLRIASFYLRNHLKTQVDLGDHAPDTNPDK